MSNIRAIRRTMRRAGIILALYMQQGGEGNCATVRRMRAAMHDATDGIRNLRSTYDDDVATSSAIDVIIENMTETIADADQWLEQVAAE